MPCSWAYKPAKLVVRFVNETVPEVFQALYDRGTQLAATATTLWGRWPMRGRYYVQYHELPDELTAAMDELDEQARHWFNELTVRVLPYTTYDKRFAYVLMRTFTAAIYMNQFHEEYEQTIAGKPEKLRDVSISTSIESAEANADGAIQTAQLLIRTAAVPEGIDIMRQPEAVSRHRPNTAFILMWMEPTRPELVDVHQAVKEVFAAFGINAIRADEVQHQDKITDVILESIAAAEFLFADLTGERPNVYYEIGYAHALKKRPILFRKTGTPLHFDLSVHNVPEYQNITELKQLLRARLEAITGKVAP